MEGRGYWTVKGTRVVAAGRRGRRKAGTTNGRQEGGFSGDVDPDSGRGL